MTKISVAIPTWEYNGFGAECLEYSFSKLASQTFKDFNVIISDNSQNDEIEILCHEWRDRLNIQYFLNDYKRGNPAVNANNAIKMSDGEWIRFLCQDDYLVDENSLQHTVDLTDGYTVWIAHAYIHTYDRKNFERYHFPSWNNDIMVINTIGTPSCIALRNLDNLPLFDEKLSYCYDCEFYYQMFLKNGQPRMGFDVTTVNFLWNQSISSGVSQELINKENQYILKKHGFIK